MFCHNCHNNFTTIYWILRCIAFIPPRTNAFSGNINESKKLIIVQAYNIGKQEILGGDNRML